MKEENRISELETKAAEIEKKLTELKEFVGSFGKWFKDQNGIIQAISDRLERLEKRARGEYPDSILS